MALTMGILYSIESVSQYIQNAGENWLSRIGFKVPLDISFSRMPTARDVRTALDALDGYQINYVIDDWSWTADVIESRISDFPDRTTLWLSNYSGDEGHPHNIALEKGSELLVIRIVELMSRTCGSLVVDNDLNGAPLLITSGTDLRFALQEWREISQRIEELTSQGYSASR
jgi:hypothetical protein